MTATKKGGRAPAHTHIHPLPGWRVENRGGRCEGAGRTGRRKPSAAASRARGPQLVIDFFVLSLSLPPPFFWHFPGDGAHAARAAADLPLPLPPTMLHHADVAAAYKVIRGADLGGPLALVGMNAHPDLTACLSECITFGFQTAAVYHSMAWFFDSPHVGLTGIGGHFKLAAMVATGDACKAADLIVKTGGHPRLGDVPAPGHDWHTEGEPDVLRAFEVRSREGRRERGRGEVGR